MNIIFRVDASTRIGSGHVRRCLLLGKYLRNRGANVSYICQSLTGDLCDQIDDQGFTIHRLRANSGLGDFKQPVDPAPAAESAIQRDAIEVNAILNQHGPFDWLAVDHYELTPQWQAAVLPSIKHLLVIDDLAIEAHKCDVLINHSLLPDLSERYKPLVDNGTKLLLGPDYFILHPDFQLARHRAHDDMHPRKRALVFFGGSDITNQTLKAVLAFKALKNDFIADIVVTHQNPNRDHIQQLISGAPAFEMHQDLSSLAERMSKADIYIGAGGSTIYESLFMGLPSIVVSTAKHQSGAAKCMATRGLVKWLGESDSTTVEMINHTLEDWFSARSDLDLVDAETRMRVVDGKGLLRIENALEHG